MAQLAGLLDLEKIRADFPILERRLADDRPLVYLDSANTSQKPQSVIDAISEHYALHNANVARAAHQLGEEATAAFEGARDKVAAFVNAPSRDGVIFTKNASEALNLVANVLANAGDPYGFGPGDEVVITEMEARAGAFSAAPEHTAATDQQRRRQGGGGAADRPGRRSRHRALFNPPGRRNDHPNPRGVTKKQAHRVKLGTATGRLARRSVTSERDVGRAGLPVPDVGQLDLGARLLGPDARDEGGLVGDDAAVHEQQPDAG